MRASDFKYAVERLFRIDSPGGGFFSNIVGAKRFAKKRSGGISGIVADEDGLGWGQVGDRFGDSRGCSGSSEGRE